MSTEQNHKEVSLRPQLNSTLVRCSVRLHRLADIQRRSGYNYRVAFIASITAFRGGICFVFLTYDIVKIAAPQTPLVRAAAGAQWQLEVLGRGEAPKSSPDHSLSQAEKRWLSKGWFQEVSSSIVVFLWKVAHLQMWSFPSTCKLCSKPSYFWVISVCLQIYLFSLV